jgi:hypothetical protein
LLTDGKRIAHEVAPKMAGIVRIHHNAAAGESDGSMRDVGGSFLKRAWSLGRSRWGVFVGSLRERDEFTALGTVFPGPKIRTWGTRHPAIFFGPGHREILEQFSIH